MPGRKCPDASDRSSLWLNCIREVEVVSIQLIASDVYVCAALTTQLVRFSIWQGRKQARQAIDLHVRGHDETAEMRKGSSAVV